MVPATSSRSAAATEADGLSAGARSRAGQTAMLRRRGHERAILYALAVAGRSVFGWDRLDAIVEGHGRESEALVPGAGLDLSRTVGWCTSHHPISVPLAVDVQPVDLRRSVADTLGWIPDRGIGFGIGRYLDPTSGLAYRPLPSVVVGFLGRVDAPSANDDVFAGSDPMTTSIHPSNPRFHDLGILAFVEGGELHVEVDGTRHHPPGQLDALADAILADLVAQADEAPLPPAAISPSLVGKRELVSLSSSALRRVTDLLARATDSKPPTG
ncbi:MAG: hypothetical protein R2710_27910 [Acidimicrobiales bacterium]